MAGTGVTAIDNLRILELMAETPKNEDFLFEDPLEQLLDEESDEEFGLPEFKEHLADTLTPAVLKDWTAQDFASIYVRFRPHLERHARRFLNNQTQVEEVVQDAFLYLMTTLPELDSELGVLKFLKWKTRLLALDVIRANSKRFIAPLEDQPEMAADMPELGAELERAEDAAIVAMALAKLQPRHREALIASVYEEKSTEVVASQLGLSENATRQLLFRARAAFKKALIGEAETAGLSMAQILSLAAKKAAQESGKIIGAAGAFLLVLAISLGVVPGLLVGPAVEEQIALQVEPEPTPLSGPSEAENSAVDPQSGILSIPQPEEPQPIVQTVSLKSSQPSPSPSPAEEERAFLSQVVRDVLDADAVRQLSRNSSGVVVQAPDDTQGSLVITNESGLTANVAYDLATQAGIQYLWLKIELPEMEFVAVPKAFLAEKSTDSHSGNVILEYVATDLLVGDNTGAFNFVAVEDSALSLGALRVRIELDSSGRILASSLSLSARSK